MTGKEIAALSDEWEHRAKDDSQWGPPNRTDVLPSPTITIRFRTAMLDTLKAVAAKRSMPYQTLIKVWLDEKIREEHDRVVRKPGPASDMLHAVAQLRDEVAVLTDALRSAAANPTSKKRLTREKTVKRRSKRAAVETKKYARTRSRRR
jgi:hypothetical protein